MSNVSGLPTPAGIKSIASRLEQLEATLPTAVSSFEPSFVAQVHRREVESKTRYLNKRYNEIKDKYVEEVNKWVQNPLSELTKVIELTVHYVETYAPIVSQIFSVAVNGDAKLSFALELIGLVVRGISEIVNSDFVKQSINHFVLIMNERKSLTAPVQVQKKKKKSFFKTIKSIGSDLR